MAEAGTDAPRRERHPSDADTDLGPPWLVIVLNDDHNTFEGVAFALSATLPGVSYDRGLRYADEIHARGRAVVWSGHHELAEHYWNRLRDFKLTMAPLERS